MLADRMPLVRPPPTPQNTGTSDTPIMACVIAGWGVKGYTAIIASALIFLIMATSVLNTSDLIRRPNTRMPLHSLMQRGTDSVCLRRFPS